MEANQVIFPIRDPENQAGATGYLWYCPGCRECHHFPVTPWIQDGHAGPVWTFNGNMQFPTFTPSLVYPKKTPLCHSIVKDGQIHFCQDSQHALAGRSVPMVPHEDWFKEREKS